MQIPEYHTTLSEESETPRHVTVYWAFQDCRTEGRLMMAAEANALFVCDPLVQTIYDTASESVLFTRTSFDRGRVEAAYGAIPPNVDELNPWDSE